jgi:hypothetical protein
VYLTNENRVEVLFSFTNFILNIDCSGNKTVPTRVATTCRENGHRQVPKQALKYRPKGKRSIGSPRKRWKDQLHFEG